MVEILLILYPINRYSIFSLVSNKNLENNEITGSANKGIFDI